MTTGSAKPRGCTFGWMMTLQDFSGKRKQAGRGKGLGKQAFCLCLSYRLRNIHKYRRKSLFIL